MKTKYVLYVEHDHAPHDVSIHNGLADAEAALLRRFKADVDPTLLANPIKQLAEMAEHLRVYECGGDNGSTECNLFRR